MKALLALLVMASGCGSEESRGLEPTCEITRLDGSYMASMTWLYGTCGEMSDINISIKSGVLAVGEACTVQFFRWGGSDCRGESNFTCVDAANGMRTRTAMVITMDPTDETVEAVAAVTITDSSGETVCSGSYGVKYSRM